MIPELIDLDKAAPLLTLLGAVGLGAWLFMRLLEYLTKLVKGIIK